MSEILKWDRFEYEIKPFCLDTLYDLWERISQASESGKVFSGSFDGACQSLLKGTTKEAQAYLINGSLVASVLKSEDVEKALAFKGRVDFFSTSFSERGLKLTQSAPDLKEQLEAKAPRTPSRTSQKDTSRGSAHSG